MNETDLEEYMKTYAILDKEYKLKEIDIEQWEEVDEEYVIPERKFRYEEMLLNVLKYLDQTGGIEFAILKDPELGRYWAKKKKEIEHALAVEAATEKLKSSLTKEELKILGIRLK